ncbi:MAG: glycogen synthase [Chloroflexi bacterium]|nr:glycogen synthase [Chloroflexota bacterium]
MENASRTPGEVMRVLFLAAEAEPLVKVGGLGDVAGTLPHALLSLTADQTFGKTLNVRLVIPFHGVIDPAAFNLRPVSSFLVDHTPEPIPAQAFETDIKGLKVYLIAGTPIPAKSPVYSIDTRKDGSKFTFFSLAALELVRSLNWRPDVVHANDWHTALAVYALSLRKPNDPFFSHTYSVLTVHNLPFMGVGAEAALAEFKLPPADDDRLPEWASRVPLPLGLLAADRIVAVSPAYAKEILTQEFGCGLEDFLKSRSNVISGILNGLDVASWDPERDPNGIIHYSEDNLSIRTMNKLALQNRFSLPQDPDVPLLVFIGRMDPQKGIDLILDCLSQMPDETWEAIILGSGIPALEEKARLLENDHPERCRAIIRYDDRLAHQLYASADILLMPSRYEPCGLSQMIAMHYGCVPVARATGGLKDTIQDYYQTKDSTGFLFESPQAQALNTAIQKCLAVRANKAAWEALQRRGMSRDFSWERSAMAYVELYHSLGE